MFEVNVGARAFGHEKTSKKLRKTLLVNNVDFRLTYTSLLVVYMLLYNASGAVHLIGSFFVCFTSYILP